jgi:hypothetical protein
MERNEMSDTPKRPKGRAAPPPEAPQPEKPRIDELYEGAGAPSEAAAALAYLHQRGRYTDVSKAITRVKRLPDGTLRFWLKPRRDQPPLELDSTEVAAADPSRLRYRRLGLVSNGAQGDDVVLSTFSVFSDRPDGLDDGIAMQALAYVRREILEMGLERITAQWLHGGPTAWLDPRMPGDAPQRQWDGSGARNLLDDEARRRAARRGGGA